VTTRLSRMHELNFATPRSDSDVSVPGVLAPARDEAQSQQNASLGIRGWLTALALTIGAVGLSATAALEYLAPPVLAPGPVATPLEPRTLQLDPRFGVRAGDPTNAAPRAKP
jgi:hypothetical protein